MNIVVLSETETTSTRKNTSEKGSFEIFQEIFQLRTEDWKNLLPSVSKSVQRLPYIPGDHEVKSECGGVERYDGSWHNLRHLTRLLSTTILKKS